MHTYVLRHVTYLRHTIPFNWIRSAQVPKCQHVVPIRSNSSELIGKNNLEKNNYSDSIYIIMVHEMALRAGPLGWLSGFNFLAKASRQV